MALLVSVLVLAVALAQVEHPGRWALSEDLHARSSHSAIQLPPLSNSELMVAAAVSDAVGPGPSRFGEAVEMHADMRDGEWQEDPERGVRQWRLQISSPGAITLSLLFDDFFLPDDGELYVIGLNETKGAFSAANNNDDGKFAVAPIRGDLLTLLYSEPLPASPHHHQPTRARIRVFKVVHGFNKNLLAFGASGTCNIDVACALNFDKNPEVRAVGMLLTDDHQRYCSGALINNADNDGKQYFLTANHCVFADVSYFIVGFNYQHEHCPGRERAIKGQFREPKPQLVQGLRLAASWDQTDYALLEIKEHIPDSYNVYMAGFDISAKPVSNVHGVHHPSGDVKKISTFKGTLLPASWSEEPESFHWRIPAWSNGVTERGSSGSPLFNEKGSIIGHLRGGQSSCEFPTGYDLYGAIAYDWVRPERPDSKLSKYLNPGNAKMAGTVVHGVFLSEARRKKRT